MKILMLFAVLFLTLALIAGYASWHFKHLYEREVDRSLRGSAYNALELLTEGDIGPLPEAVKKYIRYSGAVGKPKVRRFYITLNGKLRKDATAEWMPFYSEQYNFMDHPARFFFLNARMKHLPVAGFHCYQNERAKMDIRLLSLLKVQYQKGAEMDTAETVTFFNDMCCFAPATLIDHRITWLEAHPYKVKAAFTNNGIAITAWLFFNEDGALTSFESPDRYATAANNTLHKTPWETPLTNYREISGHRLATAAEAIYHYPDGDFCYGTFELKQIIYNELEKH